MKAMLLKPGDLSDLERCIKSDKWIGTEKIDGVRCLTVVTDKVRHISRSGLSVPGVSEGITEAFDLMAASDDDWVLDGEFVDGALHIFDIPQVGDKIKPSTPYLTRRIALERFWDKWNPGPNVRLVTAAKTTAEKQALVDTVRYNNGEGWVFNHVDSHYLPGKRGRSLKIKIRNEVDCVVMFTGIEGKNNMAVGLYKKGDTKPTEVGHVSGLTGDGKKVKAGDVVSVTYAKVSDHDRLVQPTLPKIRFDKAPRDCTFDQLQQKGNS